MSGAELHRNLILYPSMNKHMLQLVITSSCRCVTRLGKKLLLFTVSLYRLFHTAK